MAGHLPRKCVPCNGSGVVRRTEGAGPLTGRFGKVRCPACRGTEKAKTR